MKMFACLFGFALLPVVSMAKEKEEPKAEPNVTVSDVRWGTPVNDAPFDKDALAGKVVVVEEWGVNCGPCIASLPDLARLAKSNEKKGLVVVGLECQKSPKEEILKVIKTARVKYPIMAGGSAPVENSGIPFACVFDSTGKLVWHGNPHNEEFERAVKKALRDVKAAPASRL